ncbi:MAG: cation diffusion facilitator family transporter [Acidimicrobiales bacterium]
MTGKSHADGHGSAHDHSHGSRHSHDHGGAHDHTLRDGPAGFVRRLLRPHSHDHADSIDDALVGSRAGMRALVISLSGLLVTAALQLIVFSLSGSVGLLADTIHNFADAFTALPIGLALVVARRAPTRRYTYGFGRAEDLSGLAVVLVIAGSAVIAAWQSIDRLVHPQRLSHLSLVAAAGAIGFVGNELAAHYRIRIGRRIGSAALVADGYHARTDGLTSLAVVVGAAGVVLGWRAADPIVGLAITVAILAVLRGAARDVFRRLMDAVDPVLIDQVERETADVDGVHHVDNVRLRWLGHELRAELDITVERDLHVHEAHNLAEVVRHRLFHHVHRLTDATVHTNPPPAAAGTDPHELTAHHYNH